VLSDAIISVLFGENWAPSASILSILALAGLFWPIQVISLQSLLARGDSRGYLRLTVAKQGFGVAATVVGSGFGVQGLACSASRLAETSGCGN
jgi:O-antigen/teichoic acid export membrane protein